jgi:hypothetical protein
MNRGSGIVLVFLLLPMGLDTKIVEKAPDRSMTNTRGDETWRAFLPLLVGRVHEERYEASDSSITNGKK